jgi:hypothetical protein
MGVVGDLNAFMKFQAAQSMAKMAERGGDGGAMGMGFGAGFGMMMPGMMREAMASGAGQQAAGGAPTAAARPAAGAAGTAPAFGVDFSELTRATVDPKAVVRQVCQTSGYALEEQGDAWQVTATIGGLRKQMVTVRFDQKDAQGHAIVTYQSSCGPSNEQTALTLLRYNTKMVHGAFAVQKVGETEMVVIQANQLADMLNVVGVTQVLTAVAWQADQVEEKLMGSDSF